MSKGKCDHDWTGRHVTVADDVHLIRMSLPTRQTPVCTHCGLSKAYVKFKETQDNDIR